MGKVIVGDCREVMRTMPDASVDCCVTSPPYWGLRDYGHEGQIGLEETPEAYVDRMVEVFREVRRVLRDDGTLWLNIGDSYANGGGTASPHRDSSGGIGKKGTRGTQPYHSAGGGFDRPSSISGCIKPKDLCGIPWRVALALQADGWWLRQDIIWHKPNPMPESVRDRCTKAHEYVFLMSKSERYYWDHEASMVPAKHSDVANRRSVWSITTKPFKGAHFATMPLELAELCVVIGCPAGGVVLDPFFGAGTTGLAAVRNGRDYIGSELNQQYAAIAESRIAEYAPLFTQ